MKTPYGLYIGLALIVAGGFAGQQLQSQPPKEGRREVIILTGIRSFERLSDVPNTWSEPDILVSTASSSAGAPKFPPMVYGTAQYTNIPMAEALAQALSLGYQIRDSDNALGGYNYLLIK